MTLVYLDSNIVTYAVENPGRLGSAANQSIRRHRLAGAYFVVSDLVRLECRVKPVASGDGDLLNQFDVFFAAPDVEVVRLTTSVCDRATVIRARYGLKTPDALHLAAALESHCDLFLTNDAHLAGFAELAIETL